MTNLESLMKVGRREDEEEEEEELDRVDLLDPPSKHNIVLSNISHLSFMCLSTWYKVGIWRDVEVMEKGRVGIEIDS